jgi:hypothetical protein
LISEKAWGGPALSQALNSHEAASRPRKIPRRGTGCAQQRAAQRLMKNCGLPAIFHLAKAH